MTGREKIIAALSDQGTGQFPAILPYEGIYIRDCWDKLTDLPWWYPQSPDLKHQMQWRADVYSVLGHDWYDLPVFPPQERRERMRVEERGGEAFLINPETGSERRLHRPHVSGYNPDVPDCEVFNPPTSFEGMDQALPEPSEAPPAEQLQHELGSLSAAMRSGPFADRLPLWQVSSPLWSCYGLWGFEGLMTALAEDSDLLRIAAERFLQHALASVNTAAALGAEAIWMEECMMDMISPASYRRHCLPLLRSLTDNIRSRGMYSIHYFCGNPAGRLDILLDSGADALGLEEGKKGFNVDILQVAEEVQGKMALLGNVDSIAVLQNGTEEDLKDAVRHQAQAARANRGRFIMSLGSPATPGTPPERIRQFINLAHNS